MTIPAYLLLDMNACLALTFVCVGILAIWLSSRQEDVELKGFEE